MFEDYVVIPVGCRFVDFDMRPFEVEVRGYDFLRMEAFLYDLMEWLTSYPSFLLCMN